MTHYPVARIGEIPPGARKLVVVEQRAIGIYNVGGSFFALRDRCPHQGASLFAGQLLRAVESTAPGDVRYGNHYLVACPWHGWEFDIRTGQSWFDPARMRVRNYPVSVETGAAVEKGPYVAETYPVSVEDDYLTIEL